MKELITREAAIHLVNELYETGNLLNFIEKCMGEASWYGRFSHRNRRLFQDFVKEALEERGLTHVFSTKDIQNCDGS